MKKWKNENICTGAAVLNRTNIVSIFPNRRPAICMAIWFSIRCGILCAGPLRTKLLWLILPFTCISLAPKCGIEKCSRTLCGCLLPAGLHSHKCQSATTLVGSISILRLHTFVDSRRFPVRCYTFTSPPHSNTDHAICRESNFLLFFVLFFSFLVLFHFSHAHKQRNAIKNILSPLHRFTLSQSVSESDWVMRC